MILVVGGAGYIGSHMLKLLRHTNEPHVVFDNLENGHAAALQGSKLIKGDLRNPGEIDAAFDRNPQIDTVIDFAAYISVGESVREPNKYYRNNVFGTLNLLESMRNHGVDKIVFSSTAAVYGKPSYVPLDEDHPCLPINPYGWSKYFVERMLEDYGRAHGFRSVCLRYFNAAGSDPEGVLGEDHDPEEHLIPNVLLAAMGVKPHLIVFGDDYQTPDGTCVRDYIHVEDLASAHLLAVRHLREGGDSRRYNLGNGKGYSNKQVIEAAEKVVGKSIPHVYEGRRPGDSPELVADSSRVQSEWGWKPKHPDLEEIVRHAWNWRLRHPDGFADQVN
jgi:UDP-glucose 4-epimerase